MPAFQAGRRGQGCDTHDYVADTGNRRSAIDGRTTRHPSYAVSQRIRKRVEEIFGWMKTVGGFRRTRYRGLDRTGLAGYLVATAYNLVRLVRLMAARTEIPAALPHGLERAPGGATDPGSPAHTGAGSARTGLNEPLEPSRTH